MSFADGQLVPHGIYDLPENSGYMTTSKDTSEFTCDNLHHFWVSALAHKYPTAHTLLLLCDGGGANACVQYIFKQDLVELANTLAINILVAHYPAYCSNGAARAVAFALVKQAGLPKPFKYCWHFTKLDRAGGPVQSAEKVRLIPKGIGLNFFSVIGSSIIQISHF